MIPALLGLIAPVAAVKVLSALAQAAGAALRSATAPVSLPSPSVVEKAAEVSEQVSDSPVIFAYDGMSRRTKITEYTNGTVTSKKLYWWLGGSIACERDGLVSGFPITKRYFGQGVLQGTTKLFYTTDHLGSVRELVDDAGTVQAQYRYSTYGERTKETGNLDSDWGYAGLWHHGPSGLDLATYRLYDAKNKRWISRDPLGEDVDYNLYRYCGNDPINSVDPSGLDGDLTIHSRSGHSWLEYTYTGGGGPKAGTNHTYGAWPASTDIPYSGVHVDVEKALKLESVHMTRHLDAGAEKAFQEWLREQQQNRSWSPSSNCADFATEGWEVGTGKRLKNSSWRSAGIPSPDELMKSIDPSKPNMVNTGNSSGDSLGSSSKASSQTGASSSGLGSGSSDASSNSFGGSSGSWPWW